MTRYVISLGFYLNCISEYGNTLLHMAAISGDPTVVEHLLERGAGINRIEKYETTSLHYAAMGGSVGLVKLRLYHGAPVDQVEYGSGLCSSERACRGCDLPVGVDIIPRSRFFQDKYGNTALHLAVMQSHSDMICIFWCISPIYLIYFANSISSQMH